MIVRLVSVRSFIILMDFWFLRVKIMRMRAVVYCVLRCHNVNQNTKNSELDADRFA